MRLPEFDRGDGVLNRLLIGFISLASRMRLPDARAPPFTTKTFWRAAQRVDPGGNARPEQVERRRT
jgi:hypothetical protein